jgi:uncharacterized protein with FMN-binding domain
MTGHTTRLRRNAVAVGGTGLLLGLLFLYPTSTNRSNSAPTTAAPAGIVSNGGTAKSGGGSAKDHRSGTLKVNGIAAGTRYGPVQVQVTIRSQRLVAVTAIASPSSGERDQEISAFALPRLEREAIAAQSAKIDTVSGATFTSDGYRRSLQSALDAAHLHAPR